MDMFHTGLVIRGLIVLVTLCLLVIAGALLARREKRRASDSASDTPGFPIAAAGRDGDRRFAAARTAGGLRRTIPKLPHPGFSGAPLDPIAAHRES